MKMKKLLIGALALGLATVSLTFSKKNENVDYSLKNLAALQSSAGEMWCDQTNSQECRIETGGSTGYSTGVLRAQW